MKIYGLLFTIVLPSLFFCLSCGKSDGGPPKEGPTGSYYIRYKANGVPHEYTGDMLVYAFALTLPETGANQCLIQGRLHKNDENKDAIFFTVTDTDPLQEGTTYRLSERLNWPEHNQSFLRVFGSYYSPAGEKYFAQLYPLPSLPFEVKDAAEARFSQITDQTVKGTFSMRALTTYPELKEVAITDGEFYVPILASNNP